MRPSSAALRLVLGVLLLAGTLPMIAAPPVAAESAPGAVAFAGAQPVPARTSGGVAAEDVDGDGDIDLVTAQSRAEGSDAYFAVLTRQDDGTYSEPTTYTAGTGDLAGELAAGDVDGDGDIDFASGTGADGFSVAVNDGGGALSVTTHAYPYANVRALQFGDFDRDGDLDLIVAGGDIGNITLFRNDGSGAFEESQAFVGRGGSPAKLEVADYNGDGWLDVFMAEPDRPGQFNLYAGSAGWLNGPWPVSTPRPASSVRDGAFGDVDADGDLDLIVSDDFAESASGPLLYRNVGGVLSFAGAVAIDATCNVNGGPIAVADADRDGDADLVAAGGGLWFSANDGTGGFGTPSGGGGTGSGQLQIRDLDRDGLADTVIADGSSSTLEVYANSSTRAPARLRSLQFEPRTFGEGMGAGSLAVEAADFNGDGHADIAAVSAEDGQLRVRLGMGDGNFATPAVTDLTAGYGGVFDVSELITGHFDRDASLDVAVLSPGAEVVSVWLQRTADGMGTGTFERASTLPVPAPRRLSAEDYDDDGDADLSVVGAADAYVLENAGFGSISHAATLTLGAGWTGFDVTGWSRTAEGMGARAARSVAVLARNGNTSRVRTFTKTHEGVWEQTSEFDVASGPLMAADFERDGRDDLAVASGVVGGGPLSVLRWPSALLASASATVPVSASDAEAADLNRDGCLDLVVAGSSARESASPASPGGIAVLLGNGEQGSALAFSAGSALVGGPGVSDIAVADFDQDGLLDLVAADPIAPSDADGLTVYLQRPDATVPTVLSDVRASYDLSATISVVASDGAYGSGVRRVFTRLDGEPVQAADGATARVSTTLPGGHVLGYWAEDSAGNVSEPATVTFTVRRASTCTLGTSSGTVKYISPFTLSGTLASGTGLAGRTVKLQKWTSAGWVDVTATVTGAGGTFAFSQRIETKTIYRAVFEGDAQYMGSPSGSMYKIPYASLGTPAAPTAIRRGTYFTCVGALKPRHTAGTTVVRVYRQQYVRGKWVNRGYVNAKAANSSTYSKYSARIRFEFIGKWRLRAYHSDATHAPTYSAWRTVYSR